VTWSEQPVDLDLAGLPAAPPTGARYLALPPALGTAAGLRRAATALASRLLSSQKIALWRNASLGMVAAPGESRAAFAARVAQAAEERAAGELAALRERYATRIERVERQLARAGERHAGEQTELAARKREEVLAAGESVLGFLFGRRSLRSLSSAASRRRMTESAAGQAERAASEVERLREEVAALAAEVEDKAAELTAAADQVAGRIEEIAVGLERDDVRIEEIGILWCAVAAPPAGMME
jgi:hypothetical protein